MKIEQDVDVMAEALGIEPVSNETEQTQTNEPPVDLQTEDSVVETTEDNTEVSTESTTEEVVETTSEATTETEDNNETSVEINDEAVLNYLKSKGLEVDSFESLTKPKSSFANPEIESINKFIAETGRGIDDYYFVNNDLEKLPREVLAKQKLKDDNPSLDDNQIDFLFQKEDGQKPIDEDEMTEDEIKFAKENNTYAEIKLAQAAGKALNEYKEMQQKYRTPIEQKQQEDVFDVEALKSEYESIESVTFNVGKDKTFDYTFDTDENSSVLSPDEFINSYRNEDGSFNNEKFAVDQKVLRDIEKIISSQMTVERSAGREEVVKDLKNVNLSPKEQKTQTSQGFEEQMFEMMTQNNNPWQ